MSPPIGNIGGGVYWKPIFHLLEDEFEIVLVNAQHMKAVPGRKTDVKDAEWIADLLQHGLLKASFIPTSRAAGRSRSDPQPDDLARVNAADWSIGSKRCSKMPTSNWPR